MTILLIIGVLLFVGVAMLAISALVSIPLALLNRWMCPDVDEVAAGDLADAQPNRRLTSTAGKPDTRPHWQRRADAWLDAKAVAWAAWRDAKAAAWENAPVWERLGANDRPKAGRRND